MGKQKYISEYYAITRYFFHLRFKVHCAQFKLHFWLSDDHVLKVGVMQSKRPIYIWSRLADPLIDGSVLHDLIVQSSPIHAHVQVEVSM